MKINLKQRIILEKRNKWLLYTLNILLIVLCVLVVYNGLSPCEKCKLRIWTNSQFGQSAPNVLTEISCLDALKFYANETFTDIKHNPDNKFKYDTDQLNKLLTLTISNEST